MAVGSLVNSTIAKLTAMLVLAVVAVAYLPIVITNIVNLSNLADNPIPTLFASGGVLILLIFIGLFLAFLKRSQFVK